MQRRRRCRLLLREAARVLSDARPPALLAGMAEAMIEGIRPGGRLVKRWDGERERLVARVALTHGVDATLALALQIQRQKDMYREREDVGRGQT